MAKLRDQISSLQDDVSKSSDQVGLWNHVAAFRADCCRVSKFDRLCLLWLAKGITFMTLLIVCGLPLFNCALSTVCYAILLVLVDGRFGRNYSKLGNGVSDVPREAQNLYPRGSLNVRLCDCDWHSLSLKQIVKLSWNNFLQLLRNCVHMSSFKYRSYHQLRFPIGVRYSTALCRRYCGTQ